MIDLGSGILKAGMCGEMEPSCYCPSVIGVPRRLSQDVSKMKKGYYVGDEAWTMAGMLSIGRLMINCLSMFSLIGIEEFDCIYFLCKVHGCHTI